MEKESKGEITVTIYMSGSVGNELQILNKVRKGLLQVAVVTAGPFGQYDNLVGVLHYPFLFNNFKQVDEVLSGPAGERGQSDSR